MLTDLKLKTFEENIEEKKVKIQQMYAFDNNIQKKKRKNSKIGWLANISIHNHPPPTPAIPIVQFI